MTVTDPLVAFQNLGNPGVNTIRLLIIPVVLLLAIPLLASGVIVAIGLAVSAVVLKLVGFGPSRLTAWLAMRSLKRGFRRIVREITAAAGLVGATVLAVLVRWIVEPRINGLRWFTAALMIGLVAGYLTSHVMVRATGRIRWSASGAGLGGSGFGFSGFASNGFGAANPSNPVRRTTVRVIDPAELPGPSDSSPS